MFFFAWIFQMASMPEDSGIRFFNLILTTDVDECKISGKKEMIYKSTNYSGF